MEPQITIQIFQLYGKYMILNHDFGGGGVNFFLFFFFQTFIQYVSHVVAQLNNCCRVKCLQMVNGNRKLNEEQ